MERKIIITADGSSTVLIPERKVTYHSTHGAIQESKHVFIKAGLYKVPDTLKTGSIHIFEIGFGTGLNAFLTFMEAEKLQYTIYYETVEPFPLDNDEVKFLNYCKQLQREDLQTIFEQLHTCDWEKEIKITEKFYLCKTKRSLEGYKPSTLKNLIYFDPFEPNAQPGLWTQEIFKRMFSILEPGGILVTYSSKGIVRRSMHAAGFTIEKLPGPPGKREITRAGKPDRSE